MTFKPFHHLTLRAIEIEAFGDSIRRIVLADPDGWDLPPFRAGAHIDIRIPDGGIRQYSLSGDPSVRDRYEIAVLAQPEGRGGSRWVHEGLAVGDVVHASLPRNHFAIDASHEAFVLVAGGIGITPLRAMTFELDRSAKPYELWYCARDEASAAYVDELRARIPPGQLHLAFSGGTSGRRLDLEALLRKVPAGTAIYCCGPAGFMNVVRDATRDRSVGMVRFEAFSGSDATGLGAYWGAVPFVAIQVAMIALVIAFPGIISHGHSGETKIDAEKALEQLLAPPAPSGVEDPVRRLEDALRGTGRSGE